MRSWVSVDWGRGLEAVCVIRTYNRTCLKFKEKNAARMSGGVPIDMTGRLENITQTLDQFLTLGREEQLLTAFVVLGAFNDNQAIGFTHPAGVR